MAKLKVPDLPGEPHQPVSFPFPKRMFGQKKIALRSFQSTWYKSWPWLQYDEEKDVVYCHTCVRALKQKMTSSKIDAAFVFKGFSNWKDATISFRKHDSSRCHKEAVEKMVTFQPQQEMLGNYCPVYIHLKRQKIVSVFSRFYRT